MSDQNGLRRNRRTASRDALKSSLSIPSFSRENSSNSLSSEHQYYAATAPDVDYMEPAIDGPPSPERLRQLSKQMKRASYLNRPRIQRNDSSSGTSPRRAMDGRSPWETAFDSIALSRHPSSRSNSSGTPSHDRPSRESVQILGRNLFQRSGNNGGNKSKRASSSTNSSGYSGEVPGETLAFKESLMPTLFARRKPSRDDSAQKKLQISGPFNFQHVTHTQRENLPEIQRHRPGMSSEFSSMRTPGPTTAPGALQIEAHAIHHFPSASIDSVDSQHGHDDAPLTAPPMRPSLMPRHTAPALAPRRPMRSAKSSDQLRTSPPRSSLLSARSQSPTYQHTRNGSQSNGEYSPEPTGSAPVPPPRISSRQSLMPEGFSAFANANANADRPRTSGGFRQPQPFDPSEGGLDQSPPPPPATSHGFMPPADFEAFGVDEKRFSHALTTPDDGAWPLNAASVSPSSPYEKALPDVPEEEEQNNFGGWSRLSLTSNNSSLRGSQSVPALRSLSQCQQRTSGASDTLGLFDAAARPRVDDDAFPTPASPTHDSWEDVIDYCYEHEAEANHNYQWERPSLDDHRPVMSNAVNIALEEDGLAEATPPAEMTPPPELQAEPAISPSSQTSLNPISEGLSPNSNLAVTSNFSLPRGDKGSRVSQLKGIRPVSYASSFRESHGFNLSPSLLIPGDYHQQMLAEKYDYHDDDILRGPYHDELPSGEGKTPLAYQQRSSTSTTATTSTSQTDERHVSANSTFTTMTRLTVSSSSTSLNKAAGAITESEEPMPTHAVSDPQQPFIDGNTTTFIDTASISSENDQEPTPPATKDTVPELQPFPVMNFARKPQHKAHASESVAMIRDDGLGPLVSPNEKDPAKLRRPRARTSSLSAQIAPPVGQYALFPRSYIKNTGDRI